MQPIVMILNTHSQVYNARTCNSTSPAAGASLACNGFSFLPDFRSSVMGQISQSTMERGHPVGKAYLAEVADCVKRETQAQFALVVNHLVRTGASDNFITAFVK
jgi:hypothetical protein